MWVSVQRLRSPGPVGEQPQDQYVHERSGSHPGVAVGHPDRIRALPGHHGRPDPGHRRRLRPRACPRSATPWPGGCAPEPRRRPSTGLIVSHVSRPQDRHVRAAPLPWRRDDPGHHQDRTARYRALIASGLSLSNADCSSAEAVRAAVFTCSQAPPSWRALMISSRTETTRYPRSMIMPSLVPGDQATGLSRASGGIRQFVRSCVLISIGAGR
jgi:hypothetical protein